jgi:hypothetical protein
MTDSVSEELKAELEEAYAALRWVYQNGMKPDHSRPSWVSGVFNEAFASYRIARADTRLSPPVSGDMVERVAKAMYDATHAKLRCCYSWEDEWEPHQEPLRERYLNEARAAIAAMGGANGA